MSAKAKLNFGYAGEVTTGMPHRKSSGINSGQFLPGQPRPAGSGRRKGTPNKRTALIRAGVKTAVETCREGGMTPVEIMVESARFIQSVAAFKMPKQQELLTTMPKADLDWIVDLLVKAADIAAKAAPYGFPKRAWIAHVGDASAVGVENNFVIELQIAEPPAWAREGTATQCSISPTTTRRWDSCRKRR